MLWEKDSNDDDALYIDIIAAAKRPEPSLTQKNELVITRKDDALSEKRRHEGIKAFDSNEWSQAIELYNESLCSAEPDSENIGLAYAHRSDCFFQMKLYVECLKDIELAKQSNCPQETVSRLEKRKVACAKLEDASTSEQPRSESDVLKLSYDPHEQFACLANALDVRQHIEGDYSLIANRDIEVGRTIAVEDSLFSYLYRRSRWQCNVCLKSTTNLTPCKKCAAAMFCSDECRNYLHEHECGVQLCDARDDNCFMLYEIRSILWAIKLFPDVNKLIAFVEQSIRSDSKQLPDRLANEKSRYREFLKHPVGSEYINSDEFQNILFHIYTTAKHIPIIGDMFQLEPHQRFLMHLIGHHLRIAPHNQLRTRVPSSNNSDGLHWYSKTTLMTRFLQHSCAPNVMCVNGSDKRTAFITVKPIKKGELLTFSWFSSLSSSKAEHKQDIWRDDQLICKCARCHGTTATAEQRQQMQWDPLYLNVTMNYPPDDAINKDELSAMVAQCLEFLSKYGYISWSEQSDKIINIYRDLLMLLSDDTVSKQAILWHEQE